MAFGERRPYIDHSYRDRNGRQEDSEDDQEDEEEFELANLDIRAQQARLRQDVDRTFNNAQSIREDPNRRSAVGWVLGLLGTTLGIGVLASQEQETAAHHHRHPRHRTEHRLPLIESDNTPGAETFPLGAMATKHLGWGEAMLIGREHAGKLPAKEIALDFSDVLHKLYDWKDRFWTKRLAKSGKHLDISVRGTAMDRTKAYEQRWNDPTNVVDIDGNSMGYKNRSEAIGRTTLAEAADKINEVIDQVKVGFDVPAFKKLFALDDEQMTAVGTLAVGIEGQIDGQMMLAAYSLTELMPRMDGEFNCEFYDWLLQTAGAEFLANIPSLGDPATSLGQFQFTQAGYKAVLMVNSVLRKDLQLPLGNMVDLKSFYDHFKAGYLFAIYNIAFVAKVLHGEDLAAFKTLDKETLLAFMATSHNNPHLAEVALLGHLRGKGTFIECCEAVDKIHQAKHPSIKVLISEYAKKTLINFAGLHKYLATI